MPITIIPDTGTNTIYVNNDTGRNIILSGFANTAPHNTLNGLQGGLGGFYYHLGEDQYLNLTTGSVVRPSETGQFYPASNPSGFITGINTSSFATTSYVNGVSGYLQLQIDSVSASGDYYPNNNPSGYITGVDLSSYSQVNFTTGISGHLQGQINLISSTTGDFYLNTNPSGYITSAALSSYALQSSLTGASGYLQGQITTLNNTTGTFITGSVIRPSDTGIFYTINNPSGYITGVDLSSYATRAFTTGVSGSLQSQVSTLDARTGDYYPRTNPSGYITGVNQISFRTLIPTGVEETGITFPYTFSSIPRVFADFSLYSDTGYLVGMKNIAATGYIAVFSDVIEETGLYLQTLATLV